MLAGTNFHATAANTWEDGESHSVSGAVNVMDNTANNFYLSQVGLYLGSTAPTFSSPPIATVRDQVAYYVESWKPDDSTDADCMYFAGSCNTSVSIRGALNYRPKRTESPTVTQTSADTTDFRVTSNGGTDVSNQTINVSNIGQTACRVDVSVASGLVAGEAGYVFGNSTNTNILIDARH